MKYLGHTPSASNELATIAQIPVATGTGVFTLNDNGDQTYAVNSNNAGYIITNISANTTATPFGWYRTTNSSSSIPVVVTLPTAPTNGTEVVVENLSASAGLVNYISAGSDTIEGSTSAYPLSPGEFAVLTYQASSTLWVLRRFLWNATVGTTVRRDGNGRAQVVTPVATNDIANKSYVDSVNAAPDNRISGGMEMMEAPALQTAGTPTKAFSGQTYTLAGYTNNTQNSAAFPIFNGSALTTNLTGFSGNLGSFAQATLRQIPKHIRGRWVFNTGGSTSNQNITLAIWEPGYTGNGIPNNSVVHFDVSRTGWGLDQIINGTFYANLVSGTFATPLTIDGKTEYEAEVVVDYAANTIYMYLPDNTMQVYVGSNFSTYFGNCNTAAFEIYYGANTDSTISFVDYAADSLNSKRIWQARRDIKPITTIDGGTSI